MGRGKYTAQEALETLPEPTPTCPVARVLGPRGQHLHEIAVLQSLTTPEINQRLNPTSSAWFTTLAQLPPKYRSVVWVKRGSFVLANLSEQFTDKVGGEIAQVLMAEQVKHLKQTGQWPDQYEAMWEQMMKGQAGATEVEVQSEESDDDPLMAGNPNRQYLGDDETTDDEDSDEE
ncbi:hypothetical protein DL89DRAFT_269576 [Linderina pennispora]|uniref:S1-like domain-containing protein n=1 Tax=Linderina pennispora TaxID=61395 RepID=A0A1Y1W0X5_9FUNG|nr:uncharacterized protein DL89DRAFT_269576 [Linderina pennispora]KAJ1950296.1 putative RNA-binding protein eif1ad [Linderina pennispora]ORX67148.1 hypothetical protein DL89DRAFT_269576 [Linderina pennispora]